MGTTNENDLSVDSLTSGGLTKTKTAQITDADGLTVNAVKVPAQLILSFPMDATFLGAARDLWIADRAYKATVIKEDHSVVGGGSAALKLRKITDTSAPGAAAGATVKELTTAAIDLTAIVNTVVTPALSATAADLTFAAGNRLSSLPSGTVTGYLGVVSLVLIPV